MNNNFTLLSAGTYELTNENTGASVQVRRENKTYHLYIKTPHATDFFAYTKANGEIRSFAVLDHAKTQGTRELEYLTNGRPERKSASKQQVTTFTENGINYVKIDDKLYREVIVKADTVVDAEPVIETAAKPRRVAKKVTE